MGTNSRVPRGVPSGSTLHWMDLQSNRTSRLIQPLRVASNGVLLPSANHSRGAKSPAPVTAGPDLGRHNNVRIEIVGYNQRMNQNGTPPSNTNVQR
ncbi:hypothetical protein IW261DRAFT_1497443 [Armillaria novae-zelandiae]|uniref:Uncharacterized protein n=1 Tax=Armillaria novae-zelandiae TaxID=153914 RepID=A0AA39NZQ3_9AGAR|nr:hypothetical protein IW261DRAFT_1497443 [Armillaria novae-zelandiae]